jgi:hypothetical protein
MRLTRGEVLRVHPEQLRRQSAFVNIKGITCSLKFGKEKVAEVIAVGGQLAKVHYVRSPEGDGLHQRGFRTAIMDARAGVTGNRPLLTICISRQSPADTAFDLFVKTHPVGSIVSGKLQTLRRAHLKVDLGHGISGQLDEWLDHTPGERTRILDLPALGVLVDFYVRSINPVRRMFYLSLHTFSRDTRFNQFNSGYRSRYDSTGAPFQELPWEKVWAPKSSEKNYLRVERK